MGLEVGIDHSGNQAIFERRLHTRSTSETAKARTKIAYSSTSDKSACFIFTLELRSTAMSQNWLKFIGFDLLWLGFVCYAFLLAPPDQPDTFSLIQNLSTGQWNGINPLVVALFNLMGIWPLVYTCLLLVDGRGQNLAAWIFAVASFAIGAFAILPYLALRRSPAQFTNRVNGILKITESRWTGIGLGLGAIALFSYGLLNGDWSDFWQQWQTSRFIHVMSLDFCLLSLLFPVLLPDDLARRGMNQRGLWPAIAFIPLLGPIAYLSLRTPLSAQAQSLIRTEPVRTD
jgi:hypothetical protein